MSSHVLLVEDNPDDVLLLRRAMRHAGVTVQLEVHTDGDAAITHLERHLEPTEATLPALVLLDLKLPRRSGLEVLAWLRDQPRLSTLPVVILTTSADDTDIRSAYALGVNSYLVKPGAHHTYQDLIHTLAHYWLQLNARPADP